MNVRSAHPCRAVFVSVGVATVMLTLSTAVASTSDAHSAHSVSSPASTATSWKQVDVGGSHSCAIRTDKTLWCWGYNSDGELGIGDTVARSSPTQVGADTGWLSVTVGNLHTCAIRRGSYVRSAKGSGTLWCWGANAEGQLGVGDTAQRNVPVRVGSTADWASASAGGAHSCAVRTDNSLWCWGSNDSGQLGLGDLVERLTPTRVGTASWSAVSTGLAHTCGIETATPGSLWCWGDNHYGQLGVGDTTNRVTPAQVTHDFSWTFLADGGSHTCAIDTQGSLWCWGYNLHGQLGVGDTDQHNSPTQVGSSTDWASVGAGNLHTCATRADASLWCWGWNRFGQLGLGDLTNWIVPAQVAQPATSWASVTGGDFHSCGLDESHTLWCWGFNGSGQLGVGDTVGRLVPTQV